MRVYETYRTIFLLLVTIAAALCSCGNDIDRAAAEMTGGVPERGRQAIRSYGCSSCHTIPGVDGAVGMVGPSLDGIASRVYIGGVLANTPGNMIRWIRDPRGVDPKTAMPDMHVTDRDARDIAGYLYTLQ
jgi:cytochrome c2